MYDEEQFFFTPQAEFPKPSRLRQYALMIEDDPQQKINSANVKLLHQLLLDRKFSPQNCTINNFKMSIYIERIFSNIFGLCTQFIEFAHITVGSNNTKDSV